MTGGVRAEAIPRGSELWLRLAEYAQACSWRAGASFAKKLRENAFEAGDTVFALLDADSKIAGYCALCREDYIPNCEYSPWCSWVFVGEEYRGYGYVGLLLSAAWDTARESGRSALYVCSDHVGLYEKYGFRPLETRLSRDHTPQTVFVRDIPKD